MGYTGERIVNSIVLDWRKIIRVVRQNKYAIWLLVGVCAYFLFLWVSDVFPLFHAVAIFAIEYLLVAYLIRVCAGYGCMLYERWEKHGILSTIGYAIIGLFFMTLGFLVMSVCLKPGVPLHLFKSHRGQGVCIILICSAVYGFFAERRRLRKLPPTEETTRS